MLFLFFVLAVFSVLLEDVKIYLKRANMVLYCILFIYGEFDTRFFGSNVWIEMDETLKTFGFSALL